MHTDPQPPVFQFTDSEYFFDENVGTVMLFVELTAGDITQDTLVSIESGVPTDTATGI